MTKLTKQDMIQEYKYAVKQIKKASHNPMIDPNFEVLWIEPYQHFAFRVHYVEHGKDQFYSIAL